MGAGQARQACQASRSRRSRGLRRKAEGRREGREHFDIYHRLRKELDLGREAYTHRVPGFVLASHDYFHEELVRILGENDLSRMGRTYPGPVTS